MADLTEIDERLCVTSRWDFWLSGHDRR